MKEKLVVTNYDNFKNADFFKQQYLKAQEMIKETNEFFNSFCMSKLLTSKDALKIAPALVSSYQHWINYFVFPMYEYNDQVECLLKGKKYKEPKYSMYKPVSDEIAKKKCKIYSKYLIQDFNKIIDKYPDYDCYFVLDKYNILHDFVPVKCKDTISIDFLGDDISISGYFYGYDEYGARHGDCGYRICKITRKIIINGATNNVENVETYTEIIEEGLVGYKTYWDRYTNYVMTSRDNNCVSTKKWYGLRKQIRDRYNHHRDILRYGGGYNYSDEDFQKATLEAFKDVYKEYFGREITLDYVSRCCNAWE